MNKTLTRPIALIGMMGVGKSTLARLLAQRLGVPCADSDAAIEAHAQRSIADIFTHEGEAYFRALEADIIGKLLLRPAQIIALGGGALMNDKTRALLAEKAATIWLKAESGTLRERISGDEKKRPLLADGDKYAILDRLLAQREADYAKADIIADAAQSPEQIMETIISALRIKKILRP